MKKLTLAEFLKYDRESRGLYQKEYAEEIGISRSYYMRLETGKYTTPRLRVIRNISRLTGVPIKTLNEMCGGKK